MEPGCRSVIAAFSNSEDDLWLLFLLHLHIVKRKSFQRSVSSSSFVAIRLLFAKSAKPLFDFQLMSVASRLFRASVRPSNGT